jgi:hypothetical protein
MKLKLLPLQRHLAFATMCLAIILAALPGRAFGVPEADISENARQEIRSLLDEKLSWSPAQNKMESALIHAVKRSRGEPYAPGASNLRLDFKAQPDGRALVDIRATVTPELLDRIQQGGGKVLGSFPNFKSVRALVPLSELEKIAALSEVIAIRRAAESHHNAVDPEGNAVHLATLARSRFGANGSGVKVGVISDSVDYLSTVQSSGDLGTVTVLSGQSGVPATGEGTAMLEIVHAIAPGAQLFFATGDGGEASFANNILNLHSNGCTVLVDDIGYFDESPFQDATIASAVNTVTAGGALYFSAAGNSGNLDSAASGTWEGDFVDGGAATFPETGRLHKFGNLTYDTVTAVGSAVRADLFWSDPLGGSGNDYDLFVLDSTGSSIVAASTSTQNGTQDPYESVTTLGAGDRIVIVKSSGAGRFLHLSSGLGVLEIATQGATAGHQTAAKAFCVAAIDSLLAYTNAFIGGQANPVEFYSSDGPRHVFFNQDGGAITPGNFSSTGGAIRQKPDVAAADDVTTSVPGFAPFQGTSAAAPHAAAIAALLKSYNPALTPDQLRSCLTTSALDNMAPGVDRDSGYGIVMATTALASAPPDALLIAPATSVATSGKVGGPFGGIAPFVLTNNGASAFNWSLTSTSSWVTLSPTNGQLLPGGAATTVFNAANPAANALSPGVYTATMLFTNLSDHVGQSRKITLTVNPLLHGAYTYNALDLAPLGYWRLDETNTVPPADIVTNVGSLGSAANGFGFNGVIQGVPGIVQNAFRFSNSNQVITLLGAHVDVPYQTALNPNGSFTVELWANPSITVTDLFCPLASIDLTQNSGNSRLGWVFYQNTNNWQFRIGGLSGYAATLSGGSVQINSWHHLVGVYDGARASLYVDGALVAGPTAASGFGPNASQPLRIGATTIPNRTFNGLVDEVAFYNTALSAATIAAHHSAATTNNAGYGAQILAANPLGYWHLDGPAYSSPTQSSLPQAVNLGTLAPADNGTYEPGCITGVPGLSLPGLGAGNLACQFNGAGYVDIPALFLDLTGPLTLAAWVKAAPASGLVQSVVSRGAASYRLMLDAGGLPRFACGSQPAGDVIGPNRVDDQNWHLWAGVFDGTQSEFLYIDAQLAASTATASHVIAETFNDLWIGGDPDPGAFQLFNGEIAQVAVFSNALSSAQIQQMYSLATNTPAAPRFLSQTSGAGGAFTFTWSASVGETYQAQYRTNLTAGGWNNLGYPVQANLGFVTFSDLNPPDHQRFYRIVLLQ